MAMDEVKSDYKALDGDNALNPQQALARGDSQRMR
jgi:hypothetical protein